MRKSVRAIIINKNQILVIHRKKIIKGIMYEYFAFPGGGIEDNESHEECIIREIKEETGLDSVVHGEFAIISSGDSKQYFYVVNLVGGCLGTGLGDEFKKYDQNLYMPKFVCIEELKNTDNLLLSLNLYDTLVCYCNNPFALTLPIKVFTKKKLL